MSSSESKLESQFKLQVKQQKQTEVNHIPLIDLTDEVDEIEEFSDADIEPQENVINEQYEEYIIIDDDVQNCETVASKLQASKPCADVIDLTKNDTDSNLAKNDSQANTDVIEKEIQGLDVNNDGERMVIDDAQREIEEPLQNRSINKIGNVQQIHEIRHIEVTNERVQNITNSSDSLEQKKNYIDSIIYEKESYISDSDEDIEHVNENSNSGLNAKTENISDESDKIMVESTQENPHCETKEHHTIEFANSTKGDSFHDDGANNIDQRNDSKKEEGYMNVENKCEPQINNDDINNTEQQIVNISVDSKNDVEHKMEANCATVNEDSENLETLAPQNDVHMLEAQPENIQCGLKEDVNSNMHQNNFEVKNDSVNSSENKQNNNYHDEDSKENKAKSEIKKEGENSEHEVGNYDPEVMNYEPEVENNENEVGNNDPEVGNNENEVMNYDPEVGNSENEVGNNDPEVGNSENEVGNNDPEVGNNENEVMNYEPEVGNNENEVGNNDPEVGNNDPEVGNNENREGNTDIQMSELLEQQPDLSEFSENEELVHLAERLFLEKKHVECAEEYLNLTKDKVLLKMQSNRNIEYSSRVRILEACCIYYTCRKFGTARTTREIEIATELHNNKNCIKRSLKYFRSFSEFSSIPIFTIKSFSERYVKDIGCIEQKEFELILFLADFIKNQFPKSSCQNVTWARVATYIVYILLDYEAGYIIHRFSRFKMPVAEYPILFIVKQKKHLLYKILPDNQGYNKDALLNIDVKRSEKASFSQENIVASLFG